MFDYEKAAKSVEIKNFLFSSDRDIVESVCSEYLMDSSKYFKDSISLERLDNLCSLLSRFCLDNENREAEDLLSRLGFVCDNLRADYASKEFARRNGVVSSDTFPIKWYDPKWME